MMRITAVVEFEGTPQKEQRSVKPWNICEVERRLSKSFHAMVNDNLQHELCMLAWHTFTGGAGEFDDWLRGVTDVELQVGAKVDPTRRKRTAG